jgi:hypothetical protein
MIAFDAPAGTVVAQAPVTLEDERTSPALRVNTSEIEFELLPAANGFETETVGPGENRVEAEQERQTATFATLPAGTV